MKARVPCWSASAWRGWRTRRRDRCGAWTQAAGNRACACSRTKSSLLDEGDDRPARREVQLAIDLVRDIHRSGVTLVIVEHIMEVIMSLATRVKWCFIRAGRSRAAARVKSPAIPAVIAAYLERAARTAAGHTPIELTGGPPR